MFKYKFIGGSGAALAVLLGAGLTIVTFRMISGAPRNVVDYGAKSDGSDVHTNFQTAINASTGVIWVPASPTCYNLGTVGITIGSGRILQGAGMGGPSNGATCITYSGAGCAITLDSTQASSVKDLDVQVNNGIDATAAGICFKSTTSVSEFNSVENVSFKQSSATRRVAGQVGLKLTDTGNGIFWNSFRRLRAAYWDTAYGLVGGGVQGTNANHFEDLMSWGHVRAVRLTTSYVSDNRFYGIHCSRSDGTWAGNSNCVVIGDDNTLIFGNKFYDVTSDQGVPSTCVTIGTQVGGSIIDADCESGSPITDNNATTFPNRIYEVLTGATPGRLTIGRLVTTADATITGTQFVGTPGAAAANGGNVIFQSGAAGSGNQAPGWMLISPGIRTGTGQGGSITFGPNAALGISGIRMRSSRIIYANKAVAPIDCAGGNLGPTLSQLLDGSIFTCATAQTLTMPTAQGAAGLVQGLPSNGTTTPPQVGDIFQFYMSSTAAANFTLIAGAGGTIVGNAVINNASKIWTCRVTSVTAAAETISCY